MGKKIKYNEGQWFAVPLRTGGFALGIIVRGSFKTKGGLGYFFGPVYRDIPDGVETFKKNADDAVLIGWFGDLGIIDGTWPIIQNGKLMKKGEWPVPKFKKIDSIDENIGWVVEFEQENPVFLKPIRMVRESIEKLSSLSNYVQHGSGVIESALTKILINNPYK